MITLTKKQFMDGFKTAWNRLPISMREADIEILINDGEIFTELKQDPRETLWWNGMSWEKDDT